MFSWWIIKALRPSSLVLITGCSFITQTWPCEKDYTGDALEIQLTFSPPRPALPWEAYSLLRRKQNGTQSVLTSENYYCWKWNLIHCPGPVSSGCTFYPLGRTRRAEVATRLPRTLMPPTHACVSIRVKKHRIQGIRGHGISHHTPPTPLEEIFWGTSIDEVTIVV
jgi:hypothetical protein